MIKSFQHWVNENEDLDLLSLLDLGFIDIKTYLESLLELKLHEIENVRIPAEGEWFEIGLLDTAQRYSPDLEERLQAYDRWPYWDFILIGYYRSGEIHAMWRGVRQSMELKKPLADFTKDDFREFVQGIVESAE